jgi:hypothetical protein
VNPVSRTIATIAGTCALVVACGGSSTAPNRTPPGDDMGDDYGGDAGHDASGDASGDTGAGGDGGCILPTEGTSCATGENACQPSDPCCAGYEWACVGTPPTWQKEGLGCACQAGGLDAGPFACGTTTCSAGSFCEVQPPGIAGPDGSTLPSSYSCVPLPATCAAAPTCGCIESTLSSADPCSTQNPGVTCASDTSGDVTVYCLGE